MMRYKLCESPVTGAPKAHDTVLQLSIEDENAVKELLEALKSAQKVMKSSPSMTVGLKVFLKEEVPEAGE